eukprot:CAMPEP_0178487960 /NCGR_PEP_ID=MMETSP0696-20121128/9599_1 /TAXON_ID=265572 /ORGANISM="Extubocellulus spinifer, Strain CCMP396" /LENGTH=318 /DNA_ID=CAMNT_0020115685 /DNA_START=444 /DNA_END=1400 /DNA_ORIENTATION=-
MESSPEEMAEGAEVVRVLAAVLERLIGANTAVAQADPGKVTKFHALKAPGIGIHRYLERIHKYACCSKECFVLALIYIDRLIQRNNFLLTELNVHRVVITAVMLAAKFFDDAYYNNAYYAKVGGVLVPEINSLEVEFLFRVNFSLHVSSEVFQKYRAELAVHAFCSGRDHPVAQHLPKPCQMSPPHLVQQGRPLNVFGNFQEQTMLQQPVTTAFAAPVSCHEGQKITPSPPPLAGAPGPESGYGLHMQPAPAAVLASMMVHTVQGVPVSTQPGNPTVLHHHHEPMPPSNNSDADQKCRQSAASGGLMNFAQDPRSLLR